MLGAQVVSQNAESREGSSSRLKATTRSDIHSRPATRKNSVMALTIIGHPDPARVGDRATFPSLVSGNSVLLSREEPRFGPPSGGAVRPLGDARLSRRPFVFSRSGDGIIINPSGSPTTIRADGKDFANPLGFSEPQLRHGVVLVLADCVVLLLHHFVPVASRPRSFGGLVGESEAMLRLRDEIFRVANLNFPVLLRGETGTGKELVARALHEAGPRAGKPFVSVNVGAIPRELASSELFGSVRGAFTGVTSDRRGHFQRAQGGSLFLDEIGDATPEVQVSLLRVLETGQVQRLGSGALEEIDVRVTAATHVDLEAAAAAGTFRLSLLQRLAAYEIELPPLRERRDDIGRLFMYFLAADFRELLQQDSFESLPRIPTELTTQLLAYNWPGNIRELRNAVTQIVLHSGGEQELTLPPRLERRLAMTANDIRYFDEIGGTPGLDSVPSAPRHIDEVGEEELLAALKAHGWRIRPTAKALGVSRVSLYSLISKYRRPAAELRREEILEVLTSCDGDLSAAASMLHVSRKALKHRMMKVGL